MSESYDPKTGNSTIYLEGFMDNRTPEEKRAEPLQRFAQGGFIHPSPTTIRNETGHPEPTIPFLLSRGHTLMSYGSYKALGPDGVKELFPNADIEIVFTADEVREHGAAALEKLQEELDGLQ